MKVGELKRLLTCFDQNKEIEFHLHSLYMGIDARLHESTASTKKSELKLDGQPEDENCVVIDLEY